MPLFLYNIFIFFSLHFNFVYLLFASVVYFLSLTHSLICILWLDSRTISWNILLVKKYFFSMLDIPLSHYFLINSPRILSWLICWHVDRCYLYFSYFMCLYIFWFYLFHQLQYFQFQYCLRSYVYFYSFVIPLHVEFNLIYPMILIEIHNILINLLLFGQVFTLAYT